MKIDTSAVESVIKERIFPIIALDGGDMELVSITEECLVTVRFKGRYSGSPCRSILIDYLIKPILADALNTNVSVKMAD